MEQTIVQFFQGVDKELLGILVTSFVAFLCWLVKGLIEVPIANSKEVFFKYFDKRIELLSDIKVRLALIASFPGKESIPYKEQLQQILLNDGRSAYLDSDILAQILDVAITQDTVERKLVDAIQNVNLALAFAIGKVEQSNNFYSKYANVDPVKRILGYLLLTLYSVLVIVLLLLATGVACYYFVYGGLVIRVLIVIILLALILFLNRWQNK